MTPSNSNESGSIGSCLIFWRRKRYIAFSGCAIGIYTKITMCEQFNIGIHSTTISLLDIE